MEEAEEEDHARRSWHQPVTPPHLLLPSVSLLNQITPPPPPPQSRARKPISQSLLSTVHVVPLPFFPPLHPLLKTLNLFLLLSASHPLFLLLHMHSSVAFFLWKYVSSHKCKAQKESK